METCLLLIHVSYIKINNTKTSPDISSFFLHFYLLRSVSLRPVMFAMVSKSLKPSERKHNTSLTKRLTLQKPVTAWSTLLINYP